MHIDTTYSGVRAIGVPLKKNKKKKKKKIPKAVQIQDWFTIIEQY
jgi:hypothetical protein